MDVEKTLLSQIPTLLKLYDKDRKGTVLDIGVGTHNFYFELFAKCKYNVIAVEPLPTDEVKRLTKKNNVNLVEACLLDRNGITEIYSGVFNSQECLDVSSVNSDWWGIDINSKTKNVKAITLNSLIESFSIEGITYFKVDTEGAEYTIIRQFEDLEEYLHPKVIEFEYGGGGTKVSRKGGWSKKYLSDTNNCIKLLYQIGYKYILLFERENEFVEEFQIDKDTDYTNIFREHYVYGDVLMFKDRKYHIDNGRIKQSQKGFSLTDIVSKL